MTIVRNFATIAPAANTTGYMATANLAGTITNTQLAGSITSDKISSISSSHVTTALGFTPYNSTNPNGYVTSSGSVSSATNATNILGSSQSYQNVTGSRSFNTTYTNSTGKPIWVFHSATDARSGGTASGYVDGNQAFYCNMDLYPRVFACFVVPIGFTYYITSNSNNAYWFELR